MAAEDRARLGRRVARRHLKLARSVVRVGHDVAVARTPKHLAAATRLSSGRPPASVAPARPVVVARSAAAAAAPAAVVSVSAEPAPLAAPAPDVAPDAPWPAPPIERLPSAFQEWGSFATEYMLGDPTTALARSQAESTGAVPAAPPAAAVSSTTVPPAVAAAP